MSSRTRKDKQATVRLALISIPLVASIGFALFSLIAHWLESYVWASLTMYASALFGTLGLLAGTITLIFQMTRRQVNLRNVIAFGCLYVLALFVFLGSCVSYIDSLDSLIDNLDGEQPTPQESSSPTTTPVPTPIPTPTPMGAEYLRRGRQYHNVHQDYDKAIENFTEFIAINPDDPVGYYQRAVTHLELQQWQQALDDYTLAIDLNLGMPVAYVQRGNIYNEKYGEYEKALQDYEKALDLDPDYMWGHHYKGMAHSELHQYQKAIQSYEKYVELRLIESPEWIESEQAVNAHVRIGMEYIELSQYEKAIENFDIALKTDPDNTAAQDGRHIALDYINE